MVTLTGEMLSCMYARKMDASQHYLEAKRAADIFSGNTVRALIGSNVFMRVGELINGNELPESTDFDFLSDNVDVKVPDGWTLFRNRAGYAKLVHGDVPCDTPPAKLKEMFCVDVTRMVDIYQLRERPVAPTLENFLCGNMTNAQSMLYLPDQRLVMGPLGIEAMRQRRVRVLDRQNLDNHVGARIAQYNSVANYLRRKAQQLSSGDVCFTAETTDDMEQQHAETLINAP